MELLKQVSRGFAVQFLGVGEDPSTGKFQHKKPRRASRWEEAAPCHAMGLECFRRHLRIGCLPSSRSSSLLLPSTLRNRSACLCHFSFSFLSFPFLFLGFISWNKGTHNKVLSVLFVDTHLNLNLNLQLGLQILHIWSCIRPLLAGMPCRSIAMLARFAPEPPSRLPKSLLLRPLGMHRKERHPSRQRNVLPYCSRWIGHRHVPRKPCYPHVCIMWKFGRNKSSFPEASTQECFHMECYHISPRQSWTWYVCTWAFLPHANSEFETW